MAGTRNNASVAPSVKNLLLRLRPRWSVYSVVFQASMLFPTVAINTSSPLVADARWWKLGAKNSEMVGGDFWGAMAVARLIKVGGNETQDVVCTLYSVLGQPLYTSALSASLFLALLLLCPSSHLDGQRDAVPLCTCTTRSFGQIQMEFLLRCKTVNSSLQYLAIRYKTCAARHLVHCTTPKDGRQQ